MYSYENSLLPLYIHLTWFLHRLKAIYHTTIYTLNMWTDLLEQTLLTPWDTDTGLTLGKQVLDVLTFRATVSYWNNLHNMTNSM